MQKYESSCDHIHSRCAVKPTVAWDSYRFFEVAADLARGVRQNAVHEDRVSAAISLEYSSKAEGILPPFWKFVRRFAGCGRNVWKGLDLRKVEDGQNTGDEILDLSKYENRKSNAAHAQCVWFDAREFQAMR
jgi:hypothetical protein